jgi:hypothetical protein
VSLDELREHQLALREMESRLLACLVDVQGAIKRTEGDIEQASRSELALRSLDARRPKAQQRTRPGFIEVADLRAAAARLGRFVAAELGAELGCSTARAREQLQRITDVVTRDGFVAGQPRYRYVGEPEPTTASVGDLAVRRRLVVSQPRVDMVACKDLRPIVTQALADGWRLVHHKGARHPLRLCREERQIILPSTPRNPSAAARRLRRQLAA